MPNLPLSPQAAAQLLLDRRRVRTDFASWCRHALAPFGHAPAKHHLRLIEELQAVADGRTSCLMVLMPPGSAKSTYASKLFPAWWMAQGARRMVIGAAHTQTLAEKFSGDVQQFVRENAPALGYSLATEAKELWRTSNGSQYRAAGVGAKVTGFRAGIAICDDLVPGAEAADSEVQRESIWNWYLAELDSRLTPGAPVVLVMTRWHEDDIAGRLLYHQPDRWRVISLPALAEVNDPLGRAPGEPLWSDDGYGYGAHVKAKREELERAGAARVWHALYQQHPRPPEGSVFKVARLYGVPAEPTGLRCVRAWDLAATADSGKSDPDWTCGVKLGRITDGQWIVCDVVRFRGPPEEVDATILATASRDGKAVQIGLPQDPGQAGKAQIAVLTRRLAGYTVIASPETGDKATRAAPFASQVNVGNVALVEATWNRAFTEELRDFPTGRKDDQVDAASRAFAMLATAPEPARRLHVPLMAR